MALQGKIKLTNNFGEQSTFANAYFKVSSVTAIKTAATAIVSIYKEKEGRLLDERRIDFDYDLDDGAGNLLQQAYVAMKSVDPFSGLQDA